MSDLRVEIENSAEKDYRANPRSILFTLLTYAMNGRSTLDDVHFYLFIRIRKLITEKVLKDEKTFDIIKAAFESKCAYNFVKLLEEVELLEIVFPSIYALIKVDGGHYHNETVYSHVMGALRALDKLNLPWYIKLATLYHDCGKSRWEISEEGRRRFTNHATFGAQLVEGDLRRLKFPIGIISTVKTLVCYHMSHMNDKEQIHVHSLRKVKAKFDEVGIPFKYFFWVRYADNMGSAVKQTDFMYYWRVYKLSLKALNPPHIPSVKDLEVNGYDIMRNFGDHNGGGIEGKCIGYILRNLFELWQAGEIENNYKALILRARDLEYEFKEKHK